MEEETYRCQNGSIVPFDTSSYFFVIGVLDHVKVVLFVKSVSLSSDSVEIKYLPFYVSMSVAMKGNVR